MRVHGPLRDAITLTLAKLAQGLACKSLLGTNDSSNAVTRPTGHEIKYKSRPALRSRNLLRTFSGQPLEEIRKRSWEGAIPIPPV
ncbi:hypothetical protein J6590_030794 [Homalodisca vitripennis]|nr:hypothetical protein J6590_030794 [Homalodisca vitripennis]